MGGFLARVYMRHGLHGGCPFVRRGPRGVLEAAVVLGSQLLLASGRGCVGGACYTTDRVSSSLGILWGLT